MLTKLPEPVLASELPSSAETDQPEKTEVQKALDQMSPENRRADSNAPSRYEMVLKLAKDVDDRLPLILYYRSQKLKYAEIGSNLGITENAVRQIMKRARARARKRHIDWVMDNVVKPQAVQNFVEGLLLRDKDYTMAAMKGTGLLVNHTATKVEGGGTQVALVVKVETPPHLTGQPAAQVLEGSIVGTPRLTEGESDG